MSPVKHPNSMTTIKTTLVENQNQIFQTSITLSRKESVRAFFSPSFSFIYCIWGRKQSCLSKIKRLCKKKKKKKGLEPSSSGFLANKDFLETF